MKVYVPEQGIETTLSIIDPSTGINYAQEFVGNAGALSDGQFEYSEEHDAYVCSPETLEWWVQVLEQYQGLENKLHALKSEYGGERVQRVLDKVPPSDLEEYPGRAITALREEFGDA
ncbi:MAG: hypothetical protein KatS3mg051_2041 [Anaerolineae bacterium]|nr:MAG: hypothetical protein KatS3mg051_2041 [Anaerolineae bacterium]